MATESFYETMVIDTPEAGTNLAKAIEDREKNGPYVPGPVQGVNNDPELIRKLRDALRCGHTSSSICLPFSLAWEREKWRPSSRGLGLQRILAWMIF